MDLVGLVSWCHRAFVGILWIEKFFWWVFRWSKVFSHGYFVGSNFFFLGSSRVQIFSRGYFVGPQSFSWVFVGSEFFFLWVLCGSNFFFSRFISWIKDFQLLSAWARVIRTEIQKFISNHVFFSKSINNCQIRIANMLKQTPISYNSYVTWLMTSNFCTYFFVLFTLLFNIFILRSKITLTIKQTLVFLDCLWKDIWVVHRVTTSGNRWYNEWQWMATSGNEWERVVQRMKANANDFMLQNATMMQCKTTIYSAMLFWKCNVKQNICRSSHRRCSIKKQLLLTILEYSQGNTWRPATLSKRYSNTSVFQWILRNF